MFSLPYIVSIHCINTDIFIHPTYARRCVQPHVAPQVLLIKALKTLLLSHNFQVICRVLQFLYVSSRVVCVCVV